jgi:hypothetical protein
MKNNCGMQIDQIELFRRVHKFTASNGYILDAISAKEITPEKFKDPSNLYHEQLAAALNKGEVIEVDRVEKSLCH